MTFSTPVKRAFSPKVMRNSVRIALVVGTILTLINQGDLLLAGGFPPVWKLALTYLVPFCVSSYGAWCMAREQDCAPEHGS